MPLELRLGTLYTSIPLMSVSCPVTVALAVAILALIVLAFRVVVSYPCFSISIRYHIVFVKRFIRNI
jgi:hypothetical protein